MPIRLVDAQREFHPPSHPGVRRRRSVSFTNKDRPLVSALRSGGTGNSAYYYDDTPSYIPPPPPPAPPAFHSSVTHQALTGRETRPQTVPGAFPEERTTGTYTPIPNYYTTAPTPAAFGERNSTPAPIPAPIRKIKSFGDYLTRENPLGWASSLFSSRNDSSSSYSPFVSTTAYYPSNNDAIPTYSPASVDKLMATAEAKAKSEVEHERTLRLYAEQSHQETIKQHLLELELKKATQKLKVNEEAARQRVYNLSALADQHSHVHPSSLIPYAAAPAPPPAIGYATTSTALIPPPPPPLLIAGPPVPYHAYHHHHHQHPHPHHHYAIKHSHLSSEEISIRHHRREHHRCSRCSMLGHYSKECRYSPVPRRRLSSPAPLLSASAPAFSRGYLASGPGSAAASSVGGYSTDDEDWEVIEQDGYPVGRYRDEDEDEWETDGERDNGVLVAYRGGAAPGRAYPRNSVRHVVGL